MGWSTAPRMQPPAWGPFKPAPLMPPGSDLPNRLPPNQLALPTPDVPMYAAPNATPSPRLPGRSNDVNAPLWAGLQAPGGYGGGFRPFKPAVNPGLGGRF